MSRLSIDGSSVVVGQKFRQQSAPGVVPSAAPPTAAAPRAPTPKAPPRGPCAYLGEPTGALHKVSCRPSAEPLVEHRCLHVDRPGRLARRRKKSTSPPAWLPATCTPVGQCRDVVDAAPCQTCPLWTPQRLLAAAEGAERQ